jgi:hypothetical protein
VPAGLRPRRPWQPRPELTGAPPEPPPSPSRPVAASSTPFGPFSSPVCGKQLSLPNSPPYRAQCPPRELAGVAAPPPSGAGHRRSPSPSPEPLVACASFPATCSTRSCTKRRPGAHPRACAGEAPPRAAAPPLFPASSPPPAARIRPAPLDHAWTMGITYPFGLSGWSTVSPWTAPTAGSTVHPCAIRRWISDPRC